MTCARLQSGGAKKGVMKNASRATDLRRRAEVRLRSKKASPHPAAGESDSAADLQRLVHELHVHQIELEMQNAELLECRDRTGVLLEKYTDLYDFAPVGFFSLNEQSRILEMNLTGADLFGVGRSRFVNRCLSCFVARPCRAGFLAFLERVFREPGKQVIETRLTREDGTPFWASLNGCADIGLPGAQKVCRVAISDITPIKQAQEAQRQAAILKVSNEELKREIVRRQALEEELKKSGQEQCQLLAQSRDMQEQLRSLSHRVLQIQEDERKHVSRELHDEITQTLVGINVHLEALARDATINPIKLRQKIVRTQRLVETSVNLVHQFARDLRPTSLDDLGLIITLQSYLSDYMKRTGIRVHFATFAGVDHLSSDSRTVLYRIIQEALVNAAKHSRASLLKVSIRKIMNVVHLEVSDNGKAFNVNRVPKNKKSARLGLIGMRERAEMIGGTFKIESEPARGTRIHVEIPFRRDTQETAQP